MKDATGQLQSAPDSHGTGTRDQVLAKLSHNLRTPLSVVQTTVAMLLNPRYQLSPEQMREQLVRVRRNVELMNRMVSDLADLAHLGDPPAPDPQPVDALQLLREVVLSFEAVAVEKGIALACDSGPATAALVSNRARLARLFQCMVGGAVDRSRSSDRVSVRGEVHGDGLQVEVQGSGASQAADPADPGMFVARQIATAQGGEIRIDAPPAGGSRIILRLPLTT